MKKLKSSSQNGFTILDMVFAIVMPSLIIVAIVTTLGRINTENTTNDVSDSRLTESIASVEPTGLDFISINASIDYSLQDIYERPNKLFFVDNGKVLYSESNISDSIYRIDTSRSEPKSEFYSLMSLKLEDAGFTQIAGVKLTEIDSNAEQAAMYKHENANRICRVFNPLDADVSRFTCASISDDTLTRAIDLSNQFNVPREQKVYVHESYSTTYYGSEPSNEHDYEYAIGKLFQFRLAEGIPLIDNSSNEPVVFWRSSTSMQWNLFRDTATSDNRILCSDIDKNTSKALPNYVCLDIDGTFKFLGDFYAD